MKIEVTPGPPDEYGNPTFEITAPSYGLAKQALDEYMKANHPKDRTRFIDAEVTNQTLPDDLYAKEYAALLRFWRAYKRQLFDRSSEASLAFLDARARCERTVGKIEGETE